MMLYKDVLFQRGKLMTHQPEELIIKNELASGIRDHG